MTEAETLIIGAGPIGLEVAIALRQAGLAYTQIEAGQIGQTISWYPEQARFFSSADRIAIAGVPLFTRDQSKATKEEYLLYLRAIVAQFDLPVRTYTRALQIESGAEGFWVETLDILTNERRRIAARRVVCAIGDMHAPRRLEVPGEDLPFVSHYFQSPDRYFRRKLLIVGGRNSAVEAALRCHHAGATVCIAYRGKQFPEESIKYWLLPEIRSLCRAGAIEFLPETRLVSIEPGRAMLRDAHDRMREQAADFVLLLTGYTMDASLLEAAGVALEGPNRVPRFDPQTMETNIPGLYVAGTATAGSQTRHKVFIETSHGHATRIAAVLSGTPVPRPQEHRAELET